MPVTPVYVAYTGTEVTVDTSVNQIVKIESTDGTKDGKTETFKIKASVTGNGSTSAWQDIEISVFWVSPCRLATPYLATPYPDIYASVFGPTVQSSPPTVGFTPPTTASCGAYSYTIHWPAKDRAKIFLTFTNGFVSVVTNDVLDIGEYNIAVDITMDDWPGKIIKTGFRVIIVDCIPTLI